MMHQAEKTTQQAGNRRAKAFTLIELLAVIAIIAVLMSVTMPAFLNMGKGSALRSAQTQVRSALSLARQYAIMNNTSVRFIVAGVDGGTYSSQDLDKCLRAYAVYDLGENSTLNNLDDKYAKEWEYLPQGVVFDVLRTNNPVSMFHSPLTPAAHNMKFPNSASTGTRQFYFIEFSPDGRANASRSVILSEGSANWPAGQAPNPSDESHYVVNTNAPAKAVQVYIRAGRMKSYDIMP